jgi:hypothetical protein
VQLKIENQQDFYSGAMFIAFGLLAIVVARDYAMGSAMRMGPGYFPTYLGALLIVIGSMLSFRSFKARGERVKPFAWKPMILLTLAFCLFGWGIDHIGFVPALVGVILMSALGGRRFLLREVIPLTIVLVILALGIFVYGIALPFKLFWWS